MTECTTYELAKLLTDAKIELLLYDDGPYARDQIIRAKCIIDGVEYGYESKITARDPATIGQHLDRCLSKLPL